MKHKIPPYRNATLAPEKRMRELLWRMAWVEKAAQMVCVAGTGG